MRRAIIDNQTSHPVAQIRQAVRWVLREIEVDLPALMVRIVPYEGERSLGRFYPMARFRRPKVWAAKSHALKISDETRHLVITRVPRTPIPVRKYKGGPPSLEPHNWLESMIATTAHEAAHVRQFLFPKPGGPKYSEVEAEWAKYRLLKRWRERSS